VKLLYLDCFGGVSGVTVVNINNGFGAGYAASLINQLAQ
jgi:NCAIR mutase (PurE)-related protein